MNDSAMTYHALIVTRIEDMGADGTISAEDAETLTELCRDVLTEIYI